MPKASKKTSNEDTGINHMRELVIAKIDENG